MTRESPTPQPHDAADVAPSEVFGRIYAFFYNKRTGLILILAMVVLTLFGVLFAQAPASVRDDPQAYAVWLDAVRPRYRGWTDPLSFLGMFRVFDSWPFIIVTTLLAVSILACSAHRIPQLLQQATRPHLHVTDSFYEHARLRATVAMPLAPAAAGQQVRAALAERRFRVVANPDNPERDLYADRNRFAPFGTVVAHIAFVIILGGVLVTSTLGFEDPQFTVTTGSRVAVGQGTGLEVELTAFRDEYYDDGRPKDYASDLVLFQDGRQVAAHTVRVNDPLTHGGVSFNQSFFGVAAEMTVADAAGRVLFSGGVPLGWATEDGLYSYGKFELPDVQREVYVVSAASGQADRSIGAGEVRVEVYPLGSTELAASGVVAQGQPGQVGDLTVTFVRERQFTGLIVSKDPGAPWVYLGATLLMLGTCASMFFRHHRLWVRVVPSEDGSEVSVASADRPDSTFEDTFRTLVGALGSDRPVRQPQKVGQPDA